MTFCGLELVVPAVIVLLVVAVPWLSPTAGWWLALILVVVNVLVLLPMLLMLVSPRVSLSLTSLIFQLVWAPVGWALDYHSHVTLESVLPSGFRAGTSDWAELQNYLGAESSGVGQGVSDWIRHVVFVLTVVLRQEHLDVGSISLRFLLWLLGVRALLSVLATTLAAVVVDDYDQLDGERGLVHLGRVRLDALTLYSLPFYAGQLSWGLVCVGHAAMFVSTWDLLGLLLFAVCSDQRVQHTLKLQARKYQMDVLEGFEGEVLHGALILLDLVVCALFFVRAVRAEDYPVLILSYSNAFVALMELRVRVWQEMHAGLGRMSDLRRATARELKAHNDVCAVCLGPMSAARVTKCRHLFHGKCLRQALRVSPQCPLCKKQLTRPSVYIQDPAGEFE